MANHKKEFPKEISSFTLSPRVIAKLEEVSSANGKSKSYMVDTILAEKLGVILDD